MMHNVDLDMLIVDKLVSDGGLRQRETSNDSASIENIRRNGWDPACGTLCCIELEWTKEEWEAVCAERGLPVDTEPPQLLQDSIPQDEWTVSKQIDMSVADAGAEADADADAGAVAVAAPDADADADAKVVFTLRKLIMCDGNHRITGLQQLKVRLQSYSPTHSLTLSPHVHALTTPSHSYCQAGTLEFHPDNKEDREIPKAVSLIKLLYYDPAHRNDVIMASMYFNTMTSKTEWDSFLDRVLQSRSLAALYREDLTASRKQLAKASGKKVRKGEFKIAEVVDWMGVRATLLADGEQFNTPKNKVTIGVIARIGELMGSNDLVKWFQSFNHHEDRDVRKDARAVFQQRYMTCNCLWNDRSVTCVFPFRLSYVFGL